MEIAYSGDAFHTYMVISSEEWGENEDEGPAYYAKRMVFRRTQEEAF